MIKTKIREFVSAQPYWSLVEMQSNAWRREIELEILRKEERLTPEQLHPATKRFKYVELRNRPVEQRSFGCDKYGKFHDRRCRPVGCCWCDKGGHLVEIAGRADMFVSIMTRRATLELIAPS